MEPKMHFRRCQFCGAVHSKHDQLNFECESCGKELSPLYYSQIVKIIQEQASGFADILQDSPVMKERPLVGLTADWDNGPDAF
ncbi:MAG: hypothetical protein J7501_17630 [Bdellovibrio sp.]|nr:hypothetical protein [Bdellovibrio sp.]